MLHIEQQSHVDEVFAGIHCGINNNIGCELVEGQEIHQRVNAPADIEIADDADQAVLDDKSEIIGRAEFFDDVK